MSANPTDLDLHWGERIGRYQVLAQLSVGGMAELFLGFTSGPGGFRKYVALKRILPDARGDEQFERMFLDEARITAALNHPNIGQVFELGRDAEGLFLAMEFIAGQNLNQIASVCRRGGLAQPPGLSLSVVRDVCLALHYAHTFTTPGGKPSPVIHRDVSQKNVMVTYDGEVKLLDFGIAKARDGMVRTQVGMVKGTTGYMSPEQVRGEPLDGRSDLFAAGVMLHEMLTGERLFSAETERQEMEMILSAPIPALTAKAPGLPPEVSAVVLKALARNREERYPNGREMARAIEAAAGKLLFDSERRSAFMREHFQERMEVTRRLLESADAVKEPVSSGMGTESVPAAKPAARPRVRAEGLRPAQGARRGAEADTAETPAGAAVVTTGRVVTREERFAAAAPKETASTAPRASGSGGSGKFWGVIAVLLVLGGGLGFGAVKLIAAIKEQEANGTPIPVGDISPMTPIERPGQKKNPEPEVGTTAEAKTQPPARGGEAAPVNKEAPANKDGEPARNVKRGSLTLVVLPEAEVFLNGRSLGKTPLIKVPVPVGTHRLLIKGADGKRRMLSVPIETGRTAKFKLALTDIPEKS
ncbi:protein kinase [Archangium violaceum]|uniref:serine/threonine-protein kinase n=1 Tax=Archangium violaceum TaxID=83451 RepID=UPI00193BD62B|nr:serine/threonine-protein kinase [Archangium violaceum]QRK11066.1 protein kinase [Archangium violaceum]